MSANLPPTANTTKNNERGATAFMVIALGLIVLLGSPCCCYFGAGLFFGMNELRTGVYKNPARQPHNKRLRDTKYDHPWDRDKADHDRPAPWRGADRPAPPPGHQGPVDQ